MYYIGLLFRIINEPYKKMFLTIDESVYSKIMYLHPAVF